MALIAEIRNQYPNLSGYSDYEIAEIYAKKMDITLDAAITRLGLDAADPKIHTTPNTITGIAATQADSIYAQSEESGSEIQSSAGITLIGALVAIGCGTILW